MCSMLSAPAPPPPSRSPVPYVELHAHSAFSFLDGASTPEEMAETAAAMGHEALALTSPTSDVESIAASTEGLTSVDVNGESIAPSVEGPASVDEDGSVHEQSQ